MTVVTTLALDEATEQSSTPTISLLDALAETEADDESGAVEMLRIGADASFVSLFTEDVIPVSSHFLEATDSWDRTYARCLGDDCPACKAGLSRAEHLLLPVIDRIEGRVKVLRITRQKGPGKLLTELGQVLAMPNREDLVLRITRKKNFVHTVTFESEQAFDPELAQAVRSFTDKVEAGVLDVTSVIPVFPAEELATHEKIARALKLSGST